MQKALTSLDNIQNKKNENERENVTKEMSEDDLLCELLLKMLQSIPEGLEKGNVLTGVATKGNNV